MRTVSKTTITTVLLSVLLAPFGNAEARLKYYRYNDNIPMVEMSLNMMVAMGVLEPIPSRLVHDGNPYNRLVSARSGRYSRSPYAYPASTRYSGRSSYFDDYWDEPIRPYRRYSRSRYGYAADPWDRLRSDYWDSPWADRWSSPWDTAGYSPWSDYPLADRWSRSRYTGWGSPWSSRWGSPWDTAGYSPWASQWGSPWSTAGISPWASAWGNQWLNPWSSPYSYMGGGPYSEGYSGLPVLPDSILGDDLLRTRPYQQDDSSEKNNGKNGYKAEKTAWSARPSRTGYKQGKYRSGSHHTKPKLNGLWIDENGEMLGIRGDRFLWNDNNNRYAKGQLIKSPTMMEARIKETRTIIRFQYRLQGNEMVIMSRDGATRTFNRMPLIQSQYISNKPHAAHSSYQPDAENLHVQYSRYQYSSAKPKSIYPHAPPGSSAATVMPGSGKSTFAPRKASYNKPSAAKGASISYTRNRKPASQVKASISTDGGARVHNGREGLTGSVSATVKAVPERNTPEAVTEKEQVPSATHPAGADLNDPNTYLYSYLKDADSANAAVSSHPENANATGRNSGSNIWKPNNLFPHRRRDAAASSHSKKDTKAAGSELSTNTTEAGLIWSAPSTWD